MSTIAPSPPTIPPTRTALPPPPKSRRRVVGAIAAIVLLLVAAAGWLARYDPFVPGFHRYAIDEGLGARTTDVDAFGVSGRIHEVPARPGLVFTYRFSLRNDGPVAVTITRIGRTAAEQQDVVDVVREAIRIEVSPSMGTARQRWEPFRPFSLGPGDVAGIEMRATSTMGCLEPGSTLGWGSEPVAFRVFGIPRTVTFEPDVEVRLVGTPGCASA